MVIPLSDEEFLIPSKLPFKPSGFTNRVTKHAIYKEGNLNRYYQFNYIPVGFWGRIISRLMLFYSPLQCEADKVWRFPSVVKPSCLPLVLILFNFYCSSSWLFEFLPSSRLLSRYIFRFMSYVNSSSRLSS